MKFILIDFVDAVIPNKIDIMSIIGTVECKRSRFMSRIMYICERDNVLS